MSKYEYAFDMKINDSKDFQLTFIDIPSLSISASTRDDLFKQASAKLDDYIYILLKAGKKVPLPKTPAQQDKRIGLSEALQMALDFYDNK